jgi:heptosyltransferase III
MLESHGWTLGKPLVVVHPGMGGSALNWPENHYVDLVRAMVSDGRNVVVTGGKDEEALLRRIETALGALKDKAIFYGGANAGPIDELAGLFSWASLVVAPSTGPLHLAVALGKPVVCFYPPIRVQSAIRWGPYLSDSERARILVPEIYCGQDFSCRGTMCNHFPCMKSLSVNQARQHVESQLLKFAGESTGTDSQGIMDREE